MKNFVKFRLLTLLFSGQAIYTLSFAMIFTIISILAEKLSGNVIHAGVPSTVLLLSRALMAYPAGWFLDKNGRRLGLSFGYILLGLGCLVGTWAVLAQSYPLLLVAAFLLGTSRASGEQARFAAGEIVSSANRPRAIGMIVWAGTLGAMGGPLVFPWAEAVAVQWHLPAESGPWAVGAVLALLATIITLLGLFPDPQTFRSARLSSLPKVAHSAPAQEPTLKEILSLPLVQLAILAMAIGQLVMSLLMGITPVNMLHLNHSSPAISNVMMWHQIGMFGFSWATGWLVQKWGKVQTIFIGGILLVLSALTAPLWNAVLGIGAVMFLLGLGWSFCYVAGTTLLADHLKTQRSGTMQGVAEMIVAFSAAGASLVSGYAFRWNGMFACAVIGLVFSLILLGGVGVTSLREQKPATAPTF
jgi:MFS family permease